VITVCWINRVNSREPHSGCFWSVNCVIYMRAAPVPSGLYDPKWCPSYWRSSGHSKTTCRAISQKDHKPDLGMSAAGPL
jgi:hypothetical protein